MRASKYYIKTLREAPKDADIISQKLMLKSGMIKKLASGVYEWLPLGLRTLRKVEKIIREEMDKIGGLEILMPALCPKELWDETGRWSMYGKELVRIKDRQDREFCLAPTHEETVTDIVRKDVRSYKELPLLIYQIQMKFRDEIRPRFGVMRSREFLMKDAYSFHEDEKCAEKMYEKVYEAYIKIFERCGLKILPVLADTGNIGGNFSHEFMVPAATGEETISSCECCGYAANLERAESSPVPPDGKGPGEGSNVIPRQQNGESMTKSDNAAIDSRLRGNDSSVPEKIHTPGMKTVEEVGKFLNMPASSFIKTMIYRTESGFIIALMRGDYEINENKLKRESGVSELNLANEKEIENLTGAPMGFAGPLLNASADRTVQYPVSAPNRAEPPLFAKRGIGELNGIPGDVPLKIIADRTVTEIKCAVSGANEKDYHIKNIVYGRDFKADIIADIRTVKEGDNCIKCVKQLRFSKGIEVGHTFKLGLKYSEKMKAQFLDRSGKNQFMIMGCYGIGVGRIVAACIEYRNDENGMIWSKNIAPFEAAILVLSPRDENQNKVSESIYKQCLDSGMDILLDDRDISPGVKFKDADLIGYPVTIVIGKKLAEGKVEIKDRATGNKSEVPVEKALEEISIRRVKA